MKQYNVVIYGTLTNTDGVLSNFSVSNYATLPLNFNPSSQTALEIVFKFNSNSISDEQIIFQMGNISTADGYIDIEIYNSKLYFEFSSENTQRCYIEGVTALSSNADYWAKLTYDGVNTYALSLSADGTTWNTEGTANSWYYLMNAQNSYIGINQDLSQWYFDGSIDLNESYIKVNGATWWRGAESITKIQLRHDTAANWTSVNPILLEGEVGIETDTRKQKFGDGTTAWNSLPYDKGSTALQSITSSNVTTALGYTPVNKSGDTMTGVLTVEGSTTEQIIKNNINYSTYTTAGETYSDLQFQNYVGTRFNTIRSAITYDNTGTVNGSYMIFGSNKLNSSAPDGIRLLCDSNNHLTCTFPKTTCCDGAFVSSAKDLSSVQAKGSYTIDLQNYLPSGGAIYEVWLTGSNYTSGSTYSKYKLYTDIMNAQLPVNESGVNYPWITHTGTNSREGCFLIKVPVQRYIYEIIEGANLSDRYVPLTVIGYRRLGTNS